MSIPEFGDNVRIADTPLTRERGFAGEYGVIYGFTTPSVTGIEFIGGSTQNVAFNVHFENRNEAFWFAPELVQFVDHAAGTEIGFGTNKKWVRQVDGSWKEQLEARPNRPWWKFWG